MKNILTAIIITYNHKDTIEKTILSILEQDTTYPYTIQIWDDCSTDKTSEICNEYAKKYPNKIIHILQKENTFYRPLNKWSFYKNYKNIKTKYFYVIEGDDYLIDSSFFQMCIEYLEKNEKCAVVGARTHIINELEHKTSDTPEITKDIIVTIDDVGKDSYYFPLIQSRVYRNTYKDFLSGDLPMFLYHLTIGYCKIFNKITSVYNFNGNGIWSELNQRISDKLYQSTFYRMIQWYGYKHEKNWYRMLSTNNQKKIKYLSCIVGKKIAWKIWFYFLMVPTFGKESINKFWNYTNFTRKKMGEKFYENS